MYTSKYECKISVASLEREAWIESLRDVFKAYTLGASILLPVALGGYYLLSGFEEEGVSRTTSHSSLTP
jgi:hypothetical protein